MNLTLTQIIAGVSLALIVFFFMLLAALNRPSENTELRKKTWQEIEELKEEIKKDLQCFLNLNSLEKEKLEQRKKEREKNSKIPRV